MRISDKTTTRNFLKYLDNAKFNYAKTNERIASGNRFERISDDVSSGTRVLRARADLKKNEEYYNNVNSISEELSVTEGALMSINDALVNAHTKVVKAVNDPTGDSGRQALANEIAALRKEILQNLNTKYNNKFVLGGSASAVAPFSLDSNGKLLYNGISVDQIQQDANGNYIDQNGDPIPMDGDIYADIGLGIRMVGKDVQSDTAFKISYSGIEVLGFGTDAQGMPNNIFNLLTDIEKAMRNNDIDALSAYDKKLVKSTDQYSRLITDIGTKTSFLDNVKTRIESRIDSYKTQINYLMGINDAEEATNQTMNDYVLKAVLRMGANIIPVSLMDFIR